MFKFLSTIIILILSGNTLSAQFIDSFNDNNFTTNPSWTGNTNSYEIDASLQLHLNAVSQNDTSYLSTPSSSINNAVWTFSLQLTFNPSASNYAKIYLTSNKAHLKNALNGYFVKVGNTADEVSLYRQDGWTEIEIIDGLDSRVASNSVNVTIKVTRDESGNWQLFSDSNGGSSYLSEGSVFDNTHNSSSYFGISCHYTSTRSTRFYFDNFNITGSAFADVASPTIDSLIVMNDSVIKLYFNEPIEKISGQTTGNYSINFGIGNPIEAHHTLLDSAVVQLSFSKKFNNGNSYVLTIINIKDTANNNVLNITYPFTFLHFSSPVAGNVIINEIFADPTPTQGLPNAEFIELYNSSSSFYNLENWHFINSTITKTLPSFVLKPYAYLVLCDVTDTALYTPFGEVIGLSNFSALSNTADSLTLTDKNNMLINTVVYNDSWYQSSSKRSGGWSLERINPNFYCNNALPNWNASIHNNGGTPGMKNSIYNPSADVTSPTVNVIQIISPTKIKVLFNETMDSTRLFSAIYAINNGIGVATVIVHDDKQGVTFSLTTPLTPSVSYSLAIANASDCSGNSTPISFPFALPEKAVQHDVVINEILFNPYPGGSDFVEVYNNSNKFIDLKDWSLANTENNHVANLKTISDSTLILLPNEFMVFTDNPQNIADEYINTINNTLIHLQNLPPYNNSEGSSCLIDDLNIVIDSFSYSNTMHHVLLISEKGVSLERLSYSRGSNDIGNWHSAAEAVGFATPGYENSQYTGNIPSSGPVSVVPKTFSPNNDGLDDVANIRYNFSTSGLVGNIFIFNAKGILVKTLIKNISLGASGIFSWDGSTESHEKAAIGLYIVLFETFNEKGTHHTFKTSLILADYL